MMHQVATHYGFATRPFYMNAYMPRCVTWCRIEPRGLVEGIVHIDEVGLAGLDHRQHAVFEVRIGRALRALFIVLPVLIFIVCEQITRVGKCRHPAAIDETRIPADMIDMKMRTHHEVDVLGDSPATASRSRNGQFFM